MKRTLTIFFVLISLAFILSLSVSAITLQEAVDTYEGYFGGKTVESIDTIVATEHINPEIYEGYANTVSLARVELSCICGETHVYPTYYITKYYEKGQTIQDPNRTFHGKEVFHVSFDDINAKNPCGATYSKNTVIAIEIPDGYKIIDGGHENSGTTTYMCGLRASTSLRYVDMTTCSTLVELDGTSFHEAFGDSPELEYVKLADGLTAIPGWAFENCPKLKRVVISENSQIKSIGTRSFVGCTALEAFYLPESLLKITGDNKSDYGAFTGCKLMYFVDDPDSIEKPNVYYFPQSLSYIENEAIKNCPNMNNVLVFGENLTKIETQWTFATNGNSYRNETNPLTLVFKGNMTKFSYSGEQAYTTVVFANPNQGKITFNPTGNAGSPINSSFHICANGTFSPIAKNVNFVADGFKHLAEEANIGVYYTDYFENGYNVHKCFCGSEFNEETPALTPLFDDRGFSVAENDAFGGSFVHGFFVDRDILVRIEDYVDFGVVVHVNENNTEYSPILSEKAVVISMAEEMYNYVEVKIVNIPENYFDAKIISCLYVKFGEETYYIDNDQCTSAVIGKSFSEMNS